MFAGMTATEQKWAERVHGWRESGLSASDYTAGREFSAGGLRHWAYRLKKRGLPAAETETKQSTTVRVARVERIAAPTAALVIEVGPARLLVPSGADAETLKATIAALVEATRTKKHT
jgi:hypothetical protein